MKYIKTPRGQFRIDEMTLEQAENKGFFIHHYTDDMSYAVVSNGTKAFAVKKEGEGSSGE